PPAFIEPEICASLPAAVEIAFENVHLRYADAAPWALAGVDLQLAAGARVAIVGASGAGKSSLLGALLKFYPLQQGRILLGGQPLDALHGDVLRRHIAVISQQTT
ncbi:ABC transporter, ATP-binding protein, partial [mine drainage metagenome]